MKIEQIIEEVKNGKFKNKAINCKTREDAEDLTRQLAWRGYKWASGRGLRSNYMYDNYGKETCYNINRRNKTLTYSSKEFYVNEEYEIVEYEKQDSLFDLGLYTAQEASIEDSEETESDKLIFAHDRIQAIEDAIYNTRNIIEDAIEEIDSNIKLKLAVKLDRVQILVNEINGVFEINGELEED